jgi:hypothetical protein
MQSIAKAIKSTNTEYRPSVRRWPYMAPDATLDHMKSSITNNGTAINTRSKLELINEVRRQLERRDPAGLSDNAFSQQYLDRSRSYMSVVKHTGTDVSDSALLALYRNLYGMSCTWREIAETSPLSATRAIQNHVFYKELADLVFGTLIPSTR